MNKKYLAFGWGTNTYESTGGWDHYVGSGRTKKEGREVLLEAIADNKGMSSEIHHGHIVDIESGNIIYRWVKNNRKE